VSKLEQSQTALVIGSSDGIGLALCQLLIDQGWQVNGISRSESPLDLPGYSHHVCDVQSEQYPLLLRDIVERTRIDTCIYCAGVGGGIDLTRLDKELDTFEVNMMGMLKTIEAVVPSMIDNKAGHFMALSSLADVLVGQDAPSYTASKAAMSNYLKGLALNLKKQGVAVTNIRFGFVDTKMAKAPVRPFMISTESAAQKVVQCMRSRPLQFSYPRRTQFLVWLLSKITNIAMWLK